MSISVIRNFRGNKTGKHIMSFIVAWTLSLFGVSRSIDTDNFIYAIGRIHTYNNNVFNNNVYLGEGGLSPRYIIDTVFSFVMKLNGGDWAAASLWWIYFGAVIQAIAIARISYRISEKYQIICTAILACLLMYFDNNLAGAAPWGAVSTSVSIGMAFSSLAISFVVGKNKKYNWAWIFAGCTAICHIHEGIYCCAVIVIIALVDCILKKKVLIKENAFVLVAIAALALVVLPSLFTDKLDISNEAFVNIYAIFRHPHHLVPTSWGIDTILKSGWINIFIFLLSLETFMCFKKDTLREFFLKALFLEIAWFVALAATYVFTEKIPVAFVSTMFLPKSFRYVVIISLIMYLKAFFVLREEKLYFSSWLMILFAFSTSILDMKQMIICFIITAFVILAEQHIDTKKIFASDNIVMGFDILCFALVMTLRAATIRDGKAVITVFIVFFAIAAIHIAYLRKRKYAYSLSIVAGLGLILLSLYGRIIYIDGGSVQVISGEKALVNSIGKDAYDLALEFKEQTDVTGEFLADPDDIVISGGVQVVSERNCYVVKKIIPSLKNAVNDWYERYISTTGLLDKDVDEVEQIMRDSDIDYLLVKSDYFERFDDAENLSVFLESTQGSLRIYKLGEE